MGIQFFIDSLGILLQAALVLVLSIGFKSDSLMPVSANLCWGTAINPDTSRIMATV